MARELKLLVSCSAKLATAAERTATSGLMRYNSLTKPTDGRLRDSINTGATREEVAARAPIPTQRGVTALTLSALANSPSASAAHWRVLAATSLPSATATRPVYSAPIPIAAEKAAAAGAKTSVMRAPSAKKRGPEDAARTERESRDSSSGVSCGLDAAMLSRSCTGVL